MLAALRAEISNLEAEASRWAMSTQGVVVHVEVGVMPCPCCVGPTLVQKSDPRNVVTLEHGRFVAYETVRVCAARCRHPSGTLVTLRSENLSRRVPPGSTFGYDVEVFVGLARFVHPRNCEANSSSRNISLRAHDR
jgi:hypothetical protein